MKKLDAGRFAPAFALILLLCAPGDAAAQQRTDARAQGAASTSTGAAARQYSPALAPYLDAVRALAAHPKITAAFDFVERDRGRTLRAWAAITEVNAPSG